MRKKHTVTFLSIVVGVVVLICLSILSATPSSAQSVSGGVPSASGSQGSPSQSVGIGHPAITPRTSTQNGSPTYTTGDAVQYVQSHRVPHTFGSSTRPIVDSSSFMTSREASKLLNDEYIGVPDNALVCYVTFHGTFVVPAPQGQTAAFTKGIEVFDAQTGNLLLTSLQP